MVSTGQLRRHSPARLTLRSGWSKPGLKKRELKRFTPCSREKLHSGDHDNGEETWPREGYDLQLYYATLKELERRRAEQRRLDELAEMHDRGEI